MQFRQRKAFRAMLKYKNNHTLSQGGLDIGLKVGILAEIGYMLQECAMVKVCTILQLLGGLDIQRMD